MFRRALWCDDRRGKASPVRRVGALPRRHQQIGHGRRRVPHVVDVSVARRRLRAGQELSATRIAQSQLHGTAARLRDVAVSPDRRRLQFNEQRRQRPARHSTINGTVWAL